LKTKPVPPFHPVAVGSAYRKAFASDDGPAPNSDAAARSRSRAKAETKARGAAPENKAGGAKD